MNPALSSVTSPAVAPASSSPAAPRPLALLLKAKAESDRRNYGAKNEILRQLLRAYPSRFVVDSDDGRILGLTHPSTGFRIHMPASAVPDNVTLRRLRAGNPEEGSPGAGRNTKTGWDVAAELRALLQDSGDRLLELKEAAALLPATTDGYTLWYSPEHDQLRLRCCTGDAAALSGELLKYAEVELTPDEEPLERFVEPWCLVKRSYSPTVRGITDALALTPGPANAWYGGPRPLAATLLGGLAGAGLGYAAGTVGEHLAGDLLDRGRLRRTLALLGGGIGAAPGALWAAHNTAQLGPSGALRPFPHADEDAWQADQGQVRVASWDHADRAQDEENFLAGSLKRAAVAGGGMSEKIPVNDFNEVIWSSSDPFTPPALRAATVGLLESASLSRGGQDLISPSDIARIGIGMGAGYGISRLMGSTLGAMAGLSPKSQEALQQAGTWAGALKAVVPLVFGR